MEHQKIWNLVNEEIDFKFATNDQSNMNYDSGNELIYNTEVLKSNLCDYNDAYILVKGDITVIAVSFKSYAPFTKCITKTYGITIDDAEDLIVESHRI